MSEPVGGRALVANGDVTSLHTWGGHPYFFLQAGLRNGLFQGGVDLHRERFRRRRLLWNVLRPLTLERPGGFQYSRGYLHGVWAGRTEPSSTGAYVSHFPLLPPKDIVSDPVTYYLDATLHQNFDAYWGRSIGTRAKVEAIAREREAYRQARFVVCWSRWCADDVTSYYDVPAERVRVIRPGASIDEASLPAPSTWNGTLSPLRLGLIGANWEQKGGPTLLDAATRLERMGHAVEVVAIGPEATSLPSHPALRAVGHIDKSRESGRFVDLIRTLHFGCLLSGVDEAFGISTLECLRLGVPVIGTSIGGIPEAVPETAGFIVEPSRSGERLADELAAIVRAPDRYAAMREASKGLAALQSWDRTADEFLALLEG